MLEVKRPESTEKKVFDSSLYHIEETDNGWQMTDKKSGSIKTVSFLMAPRTAQEEFLAGVAYGLFYK